MRRHLTLALGVVTTALTSACATAYSDGRVALSQGRYVDATTRFEEVLARDPERLDALVGLGIAKYKLGALDEAAGALGRAVARAPKLLAARLYLGLAHLGRSEYGPAEEHLAEVTRLAPGTRTAAQVDRALRLMRGRDPLSDELRAFVAASLEDDADLEREVRETQAALREAELRRQPAATVPFAIKRGRTPLDLLFR